MTTKIKQILMGFLILICAKSELIAQNANLVWAKKVGGTNYDIGNSIILDSLGNIYVTGSFKGTVDFDPNSGVSNLTSSGSQDGFVAKYDNLGNYVWAFKIGMSVSPDYDEGKSITIDNLGNIYVAGLVSGTADFDPSTNVANLLLPGGGAYIAKYDTAGNYAWAIATPAARYINSDNDGNIYATGNFNNTADFNPSSNTANLTSSGGSDIALAKYSSNGNYIWAFKIGGTNNDYVNDIALDSLDNIYITGYYNGTVDFDPSTNTLNLVSNGGADIFVSKFDSSANLSFATSYGSSGDDAGYGLTVDRNNNIYFTGMFYLTVDFDPGNGVANITSNGNADIFIAKIDSVGNYAWANNISGNGFLEIGYSITTDFANNVYLTGMFDGTTDFDPSTGTASIIAKGNGDIFIAKYDTAGNYVWAKGIGNTNEDRGFGIAVDQFKNVYTTGFFTNTCDFDPSSNTFNLTTSGSFYDVFLLKMSQDTILTNVKKVNLKNSLSVFPNPTSDFFYIEFNSLKPNSYKLSLINVAGELIYEEKINLNADLFYKQIDVKNLSQGIYLIQLSNEDGVYVKRVIKD